MTKTKGENELETLTHILENFNVQTILAMFGISWYFAHDIKTQMERHEKRTDKLYEMFIDLLKDRK